MREQGKYLEPCIECGSTHWQAQKSQVKMGVKYRYRLCLECGAKIRTKQLPGEAEIFFATCEQSGPRPKHDFVPTEHGLSHFMVELNERNQSPKEPVVRIKLNDTSKKQKINIINHDSCTIDTVDWSTDDALESFDKYWKMIIGE